jgi:hypothetical protein
LRTGSAFQCRSCVRRRSVSSRRSSFEVTGLELGTGVTDELLIGEALAFGFRLVACGLAACVDGIEVEAGRLHNLRPKERREVRKAFRVFHGGVEGNCLVHARGEGAVRPRLAHVRLHDGARLVTEGVLRLPDMLAPSLETMREDIFVRVLALRQNGSNESVYFLTVKPLDTGKGPLLAGAVRVEAYRDGADPVAVERLQLQSGKLRAHARDDAHLTFRLEERSVYQPFHEDEVRETGPPGAVEIERARLHSLSGKRQRLRLALRSRSRRPPAIERHGLPGGIRPREDRIALHCLKREPFGSCGLQMSSLKKRLLHLADGGAEPEPELLLRGGVEPAALEIGASVIAGVGEERLPA